MALKYMVDTVDGLEEPIAKLYTKGDDGKFRLGVEGVEPADKIAGLKTAHDKDKAELAELKKKLTEREAKQAEIEAEAAKKAEELARKSGDVAALEKSWQEKLTKRERELTEQLKAKESAVESLTVDATAQKLAAELFGDGASVLVNNVRARLRTEFVEGKPTVRVLDESGNPSAMSIEELKQSFVDNKTYSRFITSRASGGGSGGAPAGGGSGAAKTMTGEAFGKLSQDERFKFIRSGGKIRS